jgi:hypothetical protein
MRRPTTARHHAGKAPDTTKLHARAHPPSARGRDARSTSPRQIQTGRIRPCAPQPTSCRQAKASPAERHCWDPPPAPQGKPRRGRPPRADWRAVEQHSQPPVGATDAGSRHLPPPSHSSSSSPLTLQIVIGEEDEKKPASANHIAPPP